MSRVQSRPKAVPTEKKEEPKVIFNAPYTYVQSYTQLGAAVRVLSRSPYLVIDCEGCNLGMRDGKLSLLSIGTAQARGLFVIDALRIKDKEEPSVVALIALLANADIPKIMWDGRGDFTEVYGHYGVAMQGIWDLQVAEVATRPLRNETDSQRIGRIVNRTQFQWKEVKREKQSGLFDDIHLIDGLGSIVSQYKLGQNLAKDSEVVAMHRAGESGRWLERPLPDRLVQYAANDIYIIATVYTFFISKKWIRPQLKAQSARYINAEVTREHKERRAQIGSSRFLPLGVLTDPTKGPVFICSWCERALELTSFQHQLLQQTVEPTQKTAKGKKGKYVTRATISLRRKPCCRVCVVSAMKSEVKLNEDWITI